ncbi:hypothetical protein GCM10010421_23320 [Streptomyces glaucus]|uniref:Isochorismatase family protein n=1 Tax=Streptomyces glaucus TaxID=284029 RepID=A0ABN3JM31_9ACTN
MPVNGFGYVVVADVGVGVRLGGSVVAAAVPGRHRYDDGDDMAANGITYTGLDALLEPGKSVLLLIDHQGAQFAGMRSMNADLVVNNVTALAKGARLFDVPTVLTTVVEDRGGHIIRQLQDVFPGQTPIDRTAINTWEDQRVVDAVAATAAAGRTRCGRDLVPDGPRLRRRPA